MDANRTSSGYELNSELARFCLPTADLETDRKLAWINSICILFLLIGILGAKPGAADNTPLLPMAEIVPAIVEPLSPPPTTTTSETQQEDPNEQEKPESPPVVIVSPNAPDIHFAVPTLGNIVAPTRLAQAPPLRPLQPPAPLKSVPMILNNTGGSGSRPQPSYPRLAQEQNQQGSVTLLLTADEAGSLVSVAVKDSSGFPILDHNALDYVQRHWTVPAGSSNRLFQATITYRLRAN